MNTDRAQWLQRAPNDALATKLNRIAWLLTAAVLGLVVVMRKVRIPLPDGVDLSFLPPFHAGVNALAACVLIAALVAVKCGNIALHRKLILAAMGLSVLFLLSYVAYHFTTAEIKFGDANHDGIVDPAEKAAVGSIRTYYLLLLLTHIVLAGVSLPFILFTFIAGWTHQFEKHRKLARWVFPIWLYVAITGPVCYWMLRPFYP
jgi:putative membrane protein